MPKIAYVEQSFRRSSLEVIEQADAICRAYAAQGFTLTLRQLFYQFVARGLLPNRDTDMWLQSISPASRASFRIAPSRLYEDRTRNLRAVPHWATPADIIDAAAQSYRIDKWARQPHYCECWIEKDALVGVIQGVCERNDVPYFSCRGYTSQSEIWAAAMRIIQKCRRGGRIPVILHLGDHDPSGIDMTRDVGERLNLFCEHHGAAWSTIRRLALNLDQVERYDPPPNPAKLTDARASGYLARFGRESWELDALDPPVIDALIQAEIDRLRDDAIWAADVAREEAERDTLALAAERWADLAYTLNGEE